MIVGRNERLGKSPGIIENKASQPLLENEKLHGSAFQYAQRYFHRQISYPGESMERIWENVCYEASKNEDGFILASVLLKQ